MKNQAYILCISLDSFQTSTQFLTHLILIILKLVFFMCFKSIKMSKIRIILFLTGYSDKNMRICVEFEKNYIQQNK